MTKLFNDESNKQQEQLTSKVNVSILGILTLKLRLTWFIMTAFI